MVGRTRPCKPWCCSTTRPTSRPPERFAERDAPRGRASLDDRLDRAFLLALSRPIRSEERAVLSALYDQHLVEYRLNPDAVDKLLKIGSHPAPADLNAVELAAWTGVARTILNLHATITRN